MVTTACHISSHTSKLCVNVQVLFIQNLQNRVEQATERRVASLLDHLGAGLLGVVLRHQRGQLVEIHDIFRCLLVGAALDEAQLLGRHADGLEHGGNDKAVEVYALLDEFDRGLEVVEEAVDISEKNGDIAAGSEELGDLDGWDEVAAVRSAGCGGSYQVGWQLAWPIAHECIYGDLAVAAATMKKGDIQLTPVDLGVLALSEDLVDNLGVQDLGEVLVDEVEPLFRVGGRHCVCMIVTF